MKYAVFTARSAAVAFETHIQLFLLANRPGYSAERWSEIIAHRDGTRWAVSLPGETIKGDYEIIEGIDGWRLYVDEDVAREALGISVKAE